jgi:hypothetical protein
MPREGIIFLTTLKLLYRQQNHVLVILHLMKIEKQKMDNGRSKNGIDQEQESEPDLYSNLKFLCSNTTFNSISTE